jgi:hypothetical protein
MRYQAQRPNAPSIKLLARQTSIVAHVSLDPPMVLPPKGPPLATPASVGDHGRPELVVYVQNAGDVTVELLRQIITAQFDVSQRMIGAGCVGLILALA